MDRVREAFRMPCNLSAFGRFASTDNLEVVDRSYVLLVVMFPAPSLKSRSHRGFFCSLWFGCFLLLCVPFCSLLVFMNRSWKWRSIPRRISCRGQPELVKSHHPRSNLGPPTSTWTLNLGILSRCFTVANTKNTGIHQSNPITRNHRPVFFPWLSASQGDVDPTVHSLAPILLPLFESYQCTELR